MTRAFTVNVLKFQTVDDWHKCLDKHGRPRSDFLLKKQSDQGLPCLLF